MALYADNMRLNSAMIICYNSNTELKKPDAGLKIPYREH